MVVEQKHIHVAVGVIVNAAGQVLVSLRQAGQHLAGCWEFPGGKVEQNETVADALCRELHEELGITVSSATPLIKIPYTYPEKTVLLDVYRVKGFHGTPKGVEGQQLRWVAEEELITLALPPANRPIITALRLPMHIAITGKYDNLDDLLARCMNLVGQGITHVQFRAPWLERSDYLALFNLLRQRLPQLTLFASTHWQPRELLSPGLENIHLASRFLPHFRGRANWVSAACHNLEELRMAEARGVDFVYFSPVRETPSHPGSEGKGWSTLATFCQQAALPVYALGGMSRADLVQARACGAQGIAAISEFWRV